MTMRINSQALNNLKVAEERIIENEVSENEVWQGLLLHNFIQWVSNALPAIADDRTSPDDLCMETFPLVALLLPKAPVQQHYVYLKFICQAVLHLSSKTVSVIENCSHSYLLLSCRRYNWPLHYEGLVKYVYRLSQAIMV